MLQRHTILLSICLIGVAGQFDTNIPPAPPPPSTSGGAADFTGLQQALDTNVVAIANLTASNEKVVGSLQSTVDKLVASNDKNVQTIVQEADRLVGKWDSSMQPTIDNLSQEASNALHAWDTSIQPSVSKIETMGRDALHAWDDSMKPRLDEALSKADDAIRVVNSTLDRWDATLSYVRTGIIPLVIALGSTWSAVCLISACICCCSPMRLSFQKPSSSSGYAMLAPFDDARSFSKGYSRLKSFTTSL